MVISKKIIFLLRFQGPKFSVGVGGGCGPSFPVTCLEEGHKHD